MTLDLDDRSARLIHGSDVWMEISDLLSGYSHIQAAMPFVGRDADTFLPLRGPASIIVNASPQALQDGATDPEVLLGWTRRGVRVYNLPRLNARVVLAEGSPSFVLVGSADASWADDGRFEAFLVADERETVDELRQAIADWKAAAGEPLTDEWLQRAVEQYRPPVPAPQVRRVELEPVKPPVPRPAAPKPVVAPVATQDRPAPAEPVVWPVPEAPAAAVAADVPDAAAIEAVDWSRPKYIYLALLNRDGRASESAEDRLAHLRQEHRVGGEDGTRPVLDVEMFWIDEPTKPGAKANVRYPEGWHVVPVQVVGTVRPTTSSVIDAPGRVLQSYTDFLTHPARTYYYLLTHVSGTTRSFRLLRDRLAEIGERPSYDHAYMMQHKVDAILDLWPEINYSS